MMKSALRIKKRLKRARKSLWMQTK